MYAYPRATEARSHPGRSGQVREEEAVSVYGWTGTP